MRNHGPSLVLGLLALTSACATDKADSPTDTTPPPWDAGSAETPASEQPAQLTYWHDMVPLFEQHCLQCHRAGGIAPFRMDEYDAVKPLAKVIAHAASERTMPPWAVTSDGSCGSFADSLALSDEEIAAIVLWADTGASEGEAGAVEVPELATLENATELTTPLFMPEAQGGALAASDEYRCFPVDHADDAVGFITGYEVLPGRAEIVHHLAAFIIDPDAQAEGEDGELLSTTNQERMQALLSETPERDGWPCFGQAGDGITMEALPVVWAPGQGVVSFPEGTGVPLEAHHQVVIQIHYNLSDPAQRGQSDQTKLRLRMQPDVEEVGVFVTVDPLLDSLFRGEPTTLPARKPSTFYRWDQSARDLGLEGKSQVKLRGVMPHMHELGRTYNMRITQPGEEAACSAQIDHWNFHWQRMYFYEQPYNLTGDTRIAVDCEYDTTSVNEPVMPGWGTSNEMCLATLFLTVPRDSYTSFFH
jgi:hypothetical protein